jgi:hypothetical protein
MKSISRTKGSDLEGELEITNGATARWVEEKEGKKRKRGWRKRKGGEPYSADESRQNETVKTTYVPNTIRIPTHKIDFSHQGLGFGARNWNRQWSHRKVSRGEGRRKERGEEERERKGSHILSMSRTMVVGATPSWVVSPNMARLDRRLMEQAC